MAICKENEQISDRYCRQLLSDMHAKQIAPLIKSRGYFPPKGTISDYQRDMRGIVSQFEAMQGGPMKMSALAAFLVSKKMESDQLIAVDDLWFTSRFNFE